MNPRSSLSLIKRSTLSVTLALLVTMPAAPTYASNPQPEPPSDPLVYRTRSTDTTKGFFSRVNKSVGLLLIGPSGVQPASGYGPMSDSEEPTEVNVNLSPTRSYGLWVSSGMKSYYSYDSALVLGFFNMAKDGSDPKYYIGSSSSSSGPDVFAQNSLSAGDATGRAVLRSPFRGAPKVWMASTVSSSYRYYDFNPEYSREDGEYEGPAYFFGQTGVSAVPAAEVSGRSTFTFDSKLTQMVQGKTFEQAAAIIEQWLQAEGYIDFSSSEQ